MKYIILCNDLGCVRNSIKKCDYVRSFKTEEEYKEWTNQLSTSETSFVKMIVSDTVKYFVLIDNILYITQPITFCSLDTAVKYARTRCIRSYEVRDINTGELLCHFQKHKL